MGNIVVALAKPEEGKGLRSILLRNGYRSVAVVSNGAQAISQMEEFGSGILICGYKLVDTVCTQLYELLPAGFEMVLMASQKYIAECSYMNIHFLPMPIKVDTLVGMLGEIEDAQARLRRKRREQPKVRSEEEKTLIAKAKETLIQGKNMTEEEAHRYLQKTSMENGTGLVETAEMILRLQGG